MKAPARHMLAGLLAFATLAVSTVHAEDAQRAVLVTGASSGIGLNVAARLAAEGYYVYAGARKPADLERLQAMDNVSAVRLDVTVPSDIAAAVGFVREQGRGLAGVVNNAGVGVFGPMNEMSEDDIRFVFDVNVLGPYRINKAFTPLLAESGGRTTTIGSINGFVSGAQAGTYAMSKFAVEAYTDALAAELEPAGIHVSVVEPGSYRSDIRDKIARHALGVDAAEATLTDEQRERLAEVAERNEALQEPDDVAAAVLHALFDENPRRRYMVTPNAGQAEFTIRAALERVVQLNRGQPYSYGRDELVALLDELLVP